MVVQQYVCIKGNVQVAKYVVAHLYVCIIDSEQVAKLVVVRPYVYITNTNQDAKNVFDVYMIDCRASVKTVVLYP